MLCSIHNNIYVSGVDALGLFSTSMNGCYYPKIDVTSPESPNFMYTMGGVYGDMNLISSSNIGDRIIWSLEHFFFEEDEDEKGYLLYSEIVRDGHGSSPADTDIWIISDIDLNTLGIAEGVSVTCGCPPAETSVDVNVLKTTDTVKYKKVLIIDVSIIVAFTIALVIFAVVRMKRQCDISNTGLDKRVEELDVGYLPI